MAWSERRTLRKHRISNSIRQRVLRRDNHRCVQCGASDELEVDHIIPMWMGGHSTEANAQTLCKPCHKLKTGREHPQVKRCKRVVDEQGNMLVPRRK